MRTSLGRPVPLCNVTLSVYPNRPIMRIKREPTRLEKKASRGHRGYPLATVAFYGPDASRASKVCVGIISAEGTEVEELRDWVSETEDLRQSSVISEEISRYLRQRGIRTVVLSPGIIGCPHEEGTDYPEGGVCPMCPYWVARDRWTGQELPKQ